MARSHLRNAFEHNGLDGEIVLLSDFKHARDASRVLWTRGFSGLFFVHEVPESFSQSRDEFEWDRFSLVRMGAVNEWMSCDTLRRSVYGVMYSSLEELMQRGFRRIGVSLLATQNTYDNDARLGALYAFKQRYEAQGVEVFWKFFEEQRDMDAAILRGLEAVLTKQPDVWLSMHWAHAHMMQRASALPKTLPHASIIATRLKVQGMPAVSGIDSSVPLQFTTALKVLETECDLWSPRPRGRRIRARAEANLAGGGNIGLLSATQ